MSGSDVINMEMHVMFRVKAPDLPHYGRDMVSWSKWDPLMED